MTLRGGAEGAFGLRSFLAWWFGELAGLVPDGLVRALGLAVDVLVLRCEGGRVELEYRRRGRPGTPVPATIEEVRAGRLPAAADRLLAGVDPRDSRVELVLDESLVLRRSLQVPRTAARELEGVLTFEIERHTPYRADEVVFAYAHDPAAGDGETMAVDLTIVPRETVDDFVRCLQGYGLAPDAVRTEAAGDDAAPGALAIDGPALGLQPRPPNRAVPAMAAAAVVLGAVAVASPLLRFEAEARALRESVAAARGHAEATLALREDVAQTRKAVRQLAEIETSSAPLIRILDTLSGLLPDGTWLRQFSKVEDKIMIEGLTDSSARLVDLLEASPLFESVSYVAPVTRERGGRVERFSFELTLAGGER